ncbi:MAG: CHAT domain-containing protein [Gemmatimonadaceae bacterium]
MPELTYINFDLRVERAGRQYRVFASGPAGVDAAEFRLPISGAELESFLLRIGLPRHIVRGGRKQKALTTTIDFGERLFRAMFAGGVESRYRRSLDEAKTRGQGLRVRLHLEEAPELANLPWEYLYDPRERRFLARSDLTPVVRFLEGPGAAGVLRVRPPLRVLVMVSSPESRDYPALDVGHEIEKLHSALRDLEEDRVAIEVLDTATQVALQRALRQRRDHYHVFHFIGHGYFDDRSRAGMLVLEGERRRPHEVDAQTLGALLYNAPTLRLVILNACEGARTDPTDPLAGVAQTLVQQGVPAVIAMQFEVTDKASIAFAHHFYGALSDGCLVDTAMAQARLALSPDEHGQQWGTPVLYLRAGDGRIFEVEPDLTPTPNTPAAVGRPESEAPDPAPSRGGAAAAEIAATPGERVHPRGAASAASAPPSVDALFARDPSIAAPTADAMIARGDIDLPTIVSRLIGLNEVTPHIVRRVLRERAAASAPLMAQRVLNVKRDWHAATGTTQCYDIAHEPYCAGELARALEGKPAPDVARVCIEGLGYLGSEGWGFRVLDVLEETRTELAAGHWHWDEYFFEKIYWYVVLALARIMVLYEGPSGLRAHGRTGGLVQLEMALEVVEDFPKASVMYGVLPGLEHVLALCGPQHADLLISRWASSNRPLLRRLAAHALGQMRLTRADSLLARLLLEDGESAEVREAASLALGNIGGPIAVDALERANRPFALSFCIHTIDEPSDFREAARRLLASDEAEKCWVYRAAGVRRDAELVPELRRALRSVEPTERGHAALALARLGATERRTLRTAYEETSVPLERTLVALALSVAGQGLSAAARKTLREDLAVDSFLYKRLTCEDILEVLRGAGDEELALIADSWEPIYDQFPAY